MHLEDAILFHHVQALDIEHSTNDIGHIDKFYDVYQ